MRTLAIETEHLGRVYKPSKRSKDGAKTRVALSDVTLSVPRGELFGLLGPNGAGKTTLIKILTTLLAPSSGWAAVEGYNVSYEPQYVRPCINMVSGGEASGYGLLTVRENLWMFAQFYGLSSADANRRIAELLAVVKMSDRLHTKSSQLSTGLRQKMNIARGFLTDPKVLFLDEPTLGLDVEASRDARAYVRQWVNDDPTRTVLLTTHYMVEADELCDRVAIINAGRVLACDARFRTLKSMYVAPVDIPMYLVGRGIARFLSVSMSVLVTIVFGIVFLHLQVNPLGVRWVLFLSTLLVGIVMLAMMGLALASIVLTIAHGSWLVGEAVAGALYLFCGAVFPIDVLPAYLRPLGYLMPVTYWLELVRRSLIGSAAGRFPTLAGIGDYELLGVLVVMTVALGAVAAATFRRCDHLARERGLIDRTSNY